MPRQILFLHNKLEKDKKLREIGSNEKGKEIVKLIKNEKLKVQTEIQKDQLRVRGKKKDDLQAVMTLLKEKDLGIHLEFVNYR